MPISKRLVAAAAMLAFAGFGSPTRADDAFRDRLAHAQGKLASAMVQKLAASKKPMIVISPASVAGAAAAIDLGASASLRTALHGLLGFHPDADVPGDLASLRDSIGRLGSAKDQTNYPLTFASSVVFDDSVALYPAAPMALKQAGVDFAVKDLRVPETIADVNRLVAERTHGLIPEIVDRNVAGASLLVLNALHFKDRWKTPFDRSDTQPVAFRRVGANPVTVSMMHLPQGKYLFRQDKQFVGIEMPYAQERFAMVVVTTRGEQPAAPAAFAGTGEWLAGKGFAAASGELALPHFDVSASEDLTPTLDQLGLKTARLAPGSLSGFTADPVRITRVQQRVELRLNEEGTEMAAATVAAIERGVDADYIRMAVNRPFVFALRDKETGLVLAAGYVGEPTTLATAAR